MTPWRQIERREFNGLQPPTLPSLGHTLSCCQDEFTHLARELRFFRRAELIFQPVNASHYGLHQSLPLVAIM
jgi:hypothetical protein